MPIRIISRRQAATGALIVSTLLGSAVLASPALAAGHVRHARRASHKHAAVTVRVLGSAPKYSPLLIRSVTLASRPVARYGGSCSGKSAAGALQAATRGNWSGTWSSNFADYEVTGINGTTLPFEPGAEANWYWGFYVNGKEATAGVCEVMPKAGDTILFLPACYGKSCPTPITIGDEAISAKAIGVRNGRRYGAKAAPRKLVAAAHSTFELESVSIALVRRSGHHCWTLTRSRKLTRSACGHVSFVELGAHHAHGKSLRSSLKLKRGLPAGHYVLEVRATDVAGDVSSPSMGSRSKVAFDVG